MLQDKFRYILLALSLIGCAAASEMPREVPVLQPSQDQDKPVVILSIDGEGMNGIIPAKLIAMMQIELGDTPITKVVDLFAGTSAGALVATCLASSPKNSASYCYQLTSQALP